MHSVIPVILYGQAEQLILFFMLLLKLKWPSTLMERKVRLSNLLVNLFQFPVKENVVRIVVSCG